MPAHPQIKFKAAYTLLAMLGLVWLNGCAQNSRNVPSSDCFDVPCVPCIFPIPLKLGHSNCTATGDSASAKP